MMKPLCVLQEQHGIDLGARYKNDNVCVICVKYIAEEQQHNLLETLSRVKIFSVQTDGSTNTEMLRMNYIRYNTLIPK